MTVSLERRTALVTGASSGLGIEFARELAARGAVLILAARSEAPMQALASELRAAGATVHVRCVDLADAVAREAFAAQLERDGLTVDVLVNNAGFGVFGPFADTEWERLDAMLAVDVVALTHLTRLFVPAMRSRGFGRVLQVASTGAFQPTPTYAAYAAAKSYVLQLSHALDVELRGTGVRCTVVSPGVTATQFFAVAGQRPTWYQRLTRMQASTVARQGVAAMLGGRSGIITGWANAVMAHATRLMPRGLSARVAGVLMRN
ncbi:SDR family NAD(P)-dependent oxidoreductase [Dyella sp.]|jgi:short-subunit dehydrogenase|uniref:SDR family NAD(P)-dependent oxidoreductase n=1 Tax=Dyella sp. TaxID=1869338 RepID=UPI002D76AE4B|nr:SDR family NAD(P)-dependent oxidoreductase [Dyella sp.]HET6431886.1 SDR family NAD(P)-dependent oxidoreductase [Dyella sp.]